MGKGKPSEIWKEIKPRIGDMVTAANDMEQSFDKAVREAYQRGYDDAKKGYENGYENGMIIAWEAARKIDHMADETIKEIFGCGFSSVFENLTASEAIEKIRQYEQEEQFHVGDEFENESGKRYVILKMDGTEIDRYIDEEGKTYCMIAKYKVMRKTGRHFPEIAEALRKMKETE